MKKRAESNWPMICKQCGTAFIEKNYIRKREYCSRACYIESKKGKSPWNKGTSMWEGKEHPKGTFGMKFPNRKPFTADQIKHLSDSHRGLKYPGHTGENHHFWKGGIAKPNDVIRHCSDLKNWRIAVFERDGYTCQDCNVKGGYLHAHHIQKFSERADLRFDIENGATLCTRCHGKRHGLIFSLIALNKCPDCGKRIKVGAKRCCPCQKAFTQSNRKKCVECGAVIQRVSERCRSCAAKINIINTQNLHHWRGMEWSGTKSNTCQSASLF